MELLCRNELGYQPVNVYLNVTCALCYVYTFHSADHQAYPLTYSADGFLTHGGENSSDLYLPTAFDRSSVVFSVAFPRGDVDHDAELWSQCCQAAADCCSDQLTLDRNDSSSASGQPGQCPMTWDGWQCWADTVKGQIATGSCPKHINPRFSPTCPTGFSEKECTKGGQWFRLESIEDMDGDFSKEWTNYTACFSLVTLEHRYQMQMVSYCVSIFFLAPALLIFWLCKQLHAQRNLIHGHFFLSLLMYAIMLIISQATTTQKIFENPDTFAANFLGTFECRLVYTLTIYLRLCNYCWMFCEGLFLLRHLKHVFRRNQKVLFYTLAGWGFPIIPVGIYIGVRSADIDCWMEPKDHYDWILKGPALLTLGFNFIFLWYIVCLLLKNLRTQYISEVEKFRRSFRVVFVLLPLFGLHFFITAYRPSESCGLQWYFLLNVALDGLQGVFVSLIFCYSNSEVISLAKRKFQTRRNRSLVQRSVSTRSGGGGATYLVAPDLPQRSPSPANRATCPESFSAWKKQKKEGKELYSMECLNSKGHRNSIELKNLINNLQFSAEKGDNPTV